MIAMNGNYLIPANSKQSLLIFGLFKPFDLVLLAVGVGVTLLLLVFIPTTSLPITIMILLPALICGLLVVPIPNYHNVLTVIQELIEFLNTRRKLVWKGWCSKNEDSEI